MKIGVSYLGIGEIAKKQHRNMADLNTISVIKSVARKNPISTLGFTAAKRLNSETVLPANRRCS